VTEGLWKNFTLFFATLPLRREITSLILRKSPGEKRIFLPQSRKGAKKILKFGVEGRKFGLWVCEFSLWVRGFSLWVRKPQAWVCKPQD
jgi:hypothetical protein